MGFLDRRRGQAGQSSQAQRLQRSEDAAAAPAIGRRAAAPSPESTRAARRAAVLSDRDGSQVEHFVVDRDEVERRRLRRWATGSVGRDDERRRIDDDDEEIAGPFYARSDDDVLEVKKRLLAERSQQRRRELAQEQTADDLDVRQLGPVYRRSVQQRDAHDVIERTIDVPMMDLEARQTQAEETCFVGNDVLSCYPTAGVEVPQGTWSKFIWNYNYPRFRQIGYVDIYLFREDTDQLQTSWLSLNNNLQRIAFSPNDPWWANRPRAARIQPGQNISWPFYFVITGAGLGTASSTLSRLSTFYAVQTALPTSVALAQAASSSSASLASLAASSSASLASASAALSDASAIASLSSSIVSSLSQAIESSMNSEGLTSTETAARTLTTTLPNGSVITAQATAQANGNPLSSGRTDTDGLALPKYAIVLISVLGFLALVLALTGAYFLARAGRKRRERRANNMGSYNSGSPMMRDVDDDGHVPAFDAAGAGAAAGAGLTGGAAAARSSRSSHESHPFSSDEATRMADAFRNALRKPEFPATFASERNSPNEEGSGPGIVVGGPARASRELGPTPASVLRDELASEGKDLKAVERGRPTVHTE